MGCRVVLDAGESFRRHAVPAAQFIALGFLLVGFAGLVAIEKLLVGCRNARPALLCPLNRLSDLAVELLVLALPAADALRHGLMPFHGLVALAAKLRRAWEKGVSERVLQDRFDSPCQAVAGDAFKREIVGATVDISEPNCS